MMGKAMLRHRHPERKCPECEGRMTWHPWRFPLRRFPNGLSYGRYYCHNYGGCEYAPG